MVNSNSQKSLPELSIPTQNSFNVTFETEVKTISTDNGLSDRSCCGCVSNWGQVNTYWNNITDDIFNDTTYYSNLSQLIADTGTRSSTNPYYRITKIEVLLTGSLGGCNGSVSFKVRGAGNEPSWYVVSSDYGGQFENGSYNKTYQLATAFYVDSNGNYRDGLFLEWTRDVCNACEGNTNLNAKLKFYITINMDKICGIASNFRKPVCDTKWCANNRADCVAPLLSYCLAPDNNSEGAYLNNSKLLQIDSTGNGDPTWCRSKFNNYFSNPPSNFEVIQQKFDFICKSKLTTIVTAQFLATQKSPLLTDTKALLVHNVCGCRGPESIYDNYYNNFIDIYGASSVNVGNKKCIFPRCTATAYRPPEVLGISNCPSAQCFTLVSINNNGTFDVENLEINSQIQGCTQYENLTGTGTPRPTTTPGPTTTPEPDDEGGGSNTGLVIGLAIGIIVIIIIIIVAIILIVNKK